MKGLGLLAHICQLLLKRRTVEMPGKMKDADPTLRSVIRLRKKQSNSAQLVAGFNRLCRGSKSGSVCLLAKYG
jgi:hypothetical protein